ncbi:GIY-YIG nuclease family protein [Patescibacteria group bacterium]
MYYVYILRMMDGKHFYVGSTNSLKKRLHEHFAGESISTRGRMWKLNCYFSFRKEVTARNFEKYLKSGSGRTFSKRHF